MKIVLSFLFSLFLFTAVFSQKNSISEFNIKGNKKLKNSFVLKISNTKQGAQLDSILIKEDIQRLKRLPAVRNATYEVIRKGKDLYIVNFNIQENFTIIPSINAYTSNNDEFAYRIGLSEFNLLGKNMILGGFFQKDIYNSYETHFIAPYLFSKKLGISLSYQNLTSQEPVFFDSGTVDYKYNNKSFETLALYELNSKNRFQIGLDYFTETYLYTPKPSDVAPPDGKQNIRVHKILYKFIYEYDNLEYHYQYISGFRNVFNFQYVSSRDDTTLPKFLIGWNDFLYYKRVGTRGNWANRLRMGTATNSNSPFAPFSVDNNVNIRGVGNTIDRGTAAIVLNTEFRYTLLDKDWFTLQGNTFVDMGSWRNPGGTFGDFSKSENIKVYPGIGIRFIHKKIFNAIFRIDYGHGITKNSKDKGLVFGIGQYF